MKLKIKWWAWYVQSSPVIVKQSGGERNLWWEGFVEKVGFEPGVKEWRSDESGDDETDRLRRGWGGESRQEWWGWQNKSGSWFQRRGDAYLNEQSVIFKEEMSEHQKLITSGESRLADAYHVWSKCVNVLVSYPAQRITEQTNDRITDKCDRPSQNQY